MAMVLAIMLIQMTMVMVLLIAVIAVLLTSTDRDVLLNGCAFVNEAQQLALDVGAGLHKGYSAPIL